MSFAISTLVLLSSVAASAPPPASGPSSTPAATTPNNPGAVLGVGGGDTPAEVYRVALKMSRGAASRVVVVPFATKGKRSGQSDTRAWQEAGARHVTNLNGLDRKSALEAIDKADIIWMGGGAQIKLMQSLAALGAVDAIQRGHRRGITPLQLCQQGRV